MKLASKIQRNICEIDSAKKDRGPAELAPGLFYILSPVLLSPTPPPVFPEP